MCDSNVKYALTWNKINICISLRSPKEHLLVKKQDPQMATVKANPID